MRIIAGLFGILGVFAALFVVLHLARVQSTAITPAALPAPTVREQSQQIQQNYQQAVEQVMEQSRRQMPEEAE